MYVITVRNPDGVFFLSWDSFSRKYVLTSRLLNACRFGYEDDALRELRTISAPYTRPTPLQKLAAGLSATRPGGYASFAIAECKIGSPQEVTTIRVSIGDYE